MSEERKNGLVKWFSEKLGYGFLNCEGQTGDIFIHRQNLLRSGLSDLTEGEKVSFVLNQGKKGNGLFATAVSKD